MEVRFINSEIIGIGVEGNGGGILLVLIKSEGRR
jgi:hypothetical protein